MSWTERPVDYDPFASPVKTLPVSKFTEIPVDYDPFATKKEEPSIEIPPPSATNQGRGIVDKLIDIVGAGGNAAMSESGMMTTADGDIAISPPKPKPLFQVSPRTISREKQLFEQGYDRGQVESIIGSNIRQEKLMSINEQEGQIKSVVDEMKTTSDPVKRLGLYSVVNRMVKDLKTNVSEYNSILSSLKGNKDQKLYESQYSDPWLDVVWKTLKTFPAKVATGAAGLAGAAEELLVNIPAEAQLMGDPSGTTWDRMREQGADSLAMKAAKTWGDVAREGSPVVVPGTQKAWFSSALDSVALNLPMALGGAVTGSITLPLVGMGLISGGQKYAELREQRPDIAIPLATAVAAGSGVMEGLTELIPLKTLLRTDLGFGKKLVNELFQEVPTEMANTIYGNLQDKMTTRPDMTWGDFIQDQIDTIGSTVIATPMMVGATHSAIKYLEKKQKQAIKATEKQVDQFLKDENVQELLKTPEGVERLKEKISKGEKPAGKRTESEKAPLPAMPPPSMGETPTDAALLFNRAGKPYKTEKSATEAMDKKGLGGTHEVVQVENGYALQKKTEKRPLVMPEPTAIAGLNDALASQAKPSPTETTTTTPQGPGAMQGESVSPVEGEKVFSTKPPIPLIEEILSNPEYYRKNKGVEATLSWMSPDEYLELQAKTKGIPLDQDLLIADKDLIAKYSDAMRKIASGEVEKQFPALWIEPANKNQEGRHRALAAKEAGVEKLPVYSINKIEEPAPTSQEAGTGTPEAPPEVPGGQSLPEEKVAAETKADVDPDATELKALIEVVQTSPREFDQSDPLTNMVSGEKYPRIFRDSIRDINFILDDRPDLKDVVPEELRKYVDENRAEKRWKELTPDVPPKPPEKKVFQKGDRVVVDGKHGEISEATTLSMRPIIGGGKSETMYTYRVKYDSGRDSAVLESQIQKETERPTEPIIPDIMADIFGSGRLSLQDPADVVDSIQHSRKKAKDYRDAAMRARTNKSKEEHLRKANDASVLAAKNQAAFDAWAAQYPEAAAKYRPLPSSVMPPIPQAKATEKPPEFNVGDKVQVKYGTRGSYPGVVINVSPSNYVVRPDMSVKDSSTLGLGASMQVPADYVTDRTVTAAPQEAKRPVLPPPKAKTQEEKKEDAYTAAVGIVSGGVADRIKNSKYEFVYGKPEKGGLAHHEMTGLFGGARADRLVEAGITIKEKVSAPPAFGSENKIFTEDKANKARELLKQKLAGINMGVPIDPEIIQAGIDLAGYYIEGGSRSFAAYSQKMINDLGDMVRPYLKSFYMAVRNYPGFDKTGMNTEAELDEVDNEIVTTEDKKALMQMLQKGDMVFYKKYDDRQSSGYFHEMKDGYIRVVSGGGLSTEVFPDDIIRAERDGKPIDLSKNGVKIESEEGGDNDRNRTDEKPAQRPVVVGTPGVDAGKLSKPGEGTIPGGETQGISGPENGEGHRTVGGNGLPGETGRPGVGSGASVNDIPSGRPGDEGQSTGTAAGEVAAADNEVDGERLPRRGNHGQNHRIGSEDTIFHSGKVSRINANIFAIETLKKLEKEDRPATDAEKKILAQFTGWGAVAQDVFNLKFDDYVRQYKGKEGRFWSDEPGAWNQITREYRPSDIFTSGKDAEKYEEWERKYGSKLHPKLGGLLTEDEWNSAQDSALNAHYTDRPVIEGMWDIVKRLGFSGGKVLEPAAGVGHFLGLMPEDLANKSKLTGIELDSITGRILGKLYPDADIQVAGFEEAKRVKDNSFDLVISNFPFGDYPVTDIDHKDYSGWSIHNYFFARSLDAVKPGGLVISITSHYSMDAVTSGKYREYLAGKADLVGAIRLPGTTFEKNAGTSVTTDIIILRKKTGDEYPSKENWRLILDVPTVEGDHIGVNEYFINHPGMVLGKHSSSGSMRGGNKEYTVLPDKSTDIKTQIGAAAEALPKNITIGSENVTADDEETIAAEKNAKESTFALHNGKVMIVHRGELVPVSFATDSKKMKQAETYINVRDARKSLIDIMLSPEATDEEIAEGQRALNRYYDDYVKKYGEFHRKMRSGFLDEDDEFPAVLSLETEVKTYVAGKKIPIRSYVKDDIFTTRTVYPFIEPTTAENLEDALRLSVTYRNGVSLDYISSLLNSDNEAVKKQLLDSGLAFEDPETGTLETREAYLSGNVRKKLKVAQDREMEKNIEALQKVIPEDKYIDEIHYKLGTEWLPEDIIESFIKDVMGVDVTVKKSHVSFSDDSATTWSIYSPYLREDDPAYTQWGYVSDSGRISGIDMIEDALNLRRVEVFDVYEDDNGNEKRTKNNEKTLVAQQKQKEIQGYWEGDRLVPGAFRDYVMQHPEHITRIETLFNQEANNFIVRQYETPSFEYYPNASHAVKLRPHQKRAVSRGLIDNGVIYAHAVGTGKTYMYSTLAMELKRIKRARKPAIVVQGSTLKQFAAQAHKLYPTAKILALEKEEIKGPEKRQAMMAKVSNGDWDMVIMAHSTFNRIPMNKEREKAFIREQLEEIASIIRAEGASPDKSKRGDSITVKQLRAILKRKEERLNKLAAIEHDVAVYFEELGIDALLIDEAHTYKRGDFFTKMGNIKGIDRGAAQKSFDFMMKCRYIQEKTSGKNVYLATGTPVSNTIAEVWTLLRYTRPEILKDYNVSEFDSFASLFGDTRVALEPTETGDYKFVERFNKYSNGVQLINMWLSGADVILQEDVPGWSDMVPKLKDGEFTKISLERTKELEAFIEDIRRRKQEWENLDGREKIAQRHVPITLYTEARKGSVDLRLVHPHNPDMKGNKANAAVDVAFKKWEETAEDKGTQLIFCDLYQSPNPTAQKWIDPQNHKMGKELAFPELSRIKRFNLFEDIKKKLIDKGVPADEIAIITDDKYSSDDAKEKLFEKVNSGAVRILMGTTERLGIGVNVQERLANVIHLDAPNRPMDFEQRNGRIVRPGNGFKQVEVILLATVNSMDEVIYDRLQKKQKFTNQLLRGNIQGNTFDDPSDEVQQTIEEMIAIASGNPLVKKRFELENNIRELETLQTGHIHKIGRLRRSIEEERESISRSKKYLSETEDKVRELKEIFDTESFSIDINGKVYEDEKEGIRALNDILNEQSDRISSQYEARLKEIEKRVAKEIEAAKEVKTSDGKTIPKVDVWKVKDILADGSYQQIPLSVKVNGRDLKIFGSAKGPSMLSSGDDLSQFKGNANVLFIYSFLPYFPTSNNYKSAKGIMDSLLNQIVDIYKEPDFLKEGIARKEKNLSVMEEEVGKTFPHTERLADLKSQYAEVLASLGISSNADVADTDLSPEEMASMANMNYLRQQANETWEAYLKREDLNLSTYIEELDNDEDKGIYAVWAARKAQAIAILSQDEGEKFTIELAQDYLDQARDKWENRVEEEPYPHEINLANQVIRSIRQGQGKLWEAEMYSRRRRAETPMSRDDLEQYARKLMGDADNQPGLVVVEKASELPFDAPEDAGGAYHDGTMYLVAEKIALPEDADEVIFHEFIGHFGLRGFFGDRLNAALDRIHVNNPLVQQYTNEWMKDNRDYQKKRGMSDLDYHYRAIEEAMARMAQENKPFTFAKRLLSSVQSLLRNVGMTRLADSLEAKTNAEALAMLHKAGLYIRKGKTIGAKIPEPLYPFFMAAYSGLDPIAAMQALRDVAHDIKAALPRLEALGKSVYNSGITTAKEWYAAMHKHLGDLWFKFNWYLNGIWKNLQTMDRERKSLSEERGSFSWLKKAPKEKQEENPPGPEGETKESRQAIRAEEDAFAAGMEADFGDLVSYQTMNMNDLYDAAQGIVDADYASAKRMAMGDEKPPRGIHAAAMYEVVKLRAIREKDIDTLRLLATESIVPKMLSEMGQAIKAADSRIIADPVAAMSDVAKERAERIKRTTGEEYNEQAVNELRKKLEEAQKQLDKYIAENEERAAEEEIDRLIREKEKKTLKDLYGKRNKIVTRDEYNATLARIRERHSRLSMGIDPTELIDLAKIGIYHLEAGIRDFKLWSRQMTKDLGDWVKPHLPEIWDKAQEDLKQAAVKDVKQKVEREAKKTGGDLSELSNISMYAQKLAKEFIAQGTNDRNTLIDQVHDALKAEIDPEITRRETMDAISGYGQYKQLSKDEISVILRDLKGQMQQIAKIEDMVSGNAPLKTGVERRTPSDEERRLIKQVEEAKRKYGIQTTDKETQLRSALDAIKTRLRNQISDLEAQIKTGKKIVKGKSGVIYDAEANALVKRRDELKEAYTSIFGKPKMSDAQRLKMAIAAVQKSIAEYTKRINNNDVSPLVKPGKPISSPALDSLRSERERLRLEFKHLRDLANPRKTPEEIALQALKTRLKHEYEKMSKRLKDGDFTAREKREISLDDEGKRLKSERDKIRDIYNAAKEIGGTVSREEAGHILEMSSIVMEKKAAMDKGGNRLEYGAAVVALERYIEDLKGENASIGEALGDRMREFRATFGRNKSKAFLDLAMDSIKKITDTSISLVASLDNSFLGRQGIKVLMTHPSAWWPAAQRSFSDIIVTIGGKNAMDAMLADIYSRPNFVNGRYGTAKIISKTEEQYPTSLPEKMPVMGRFFKASQAAFRGSALRMRADLFDMLSQTAEDGGVKLDKQELIDIGKLINSLTARGQWGKRGEGAITRIILWAPKMLKANIDTLTAHRLDRDMESTFAKRQAAVNLVKIIAGCAVIMAIANALRPGSADTDPRSTDFGKIKIGDTRFDITGGMGSIITLAARIISQSSKSAATGIVTPLGSKFGQRSAFDVLSDFLVNKTSPPARVIVDWLRGKNWKGEKFSWSGSAYQAFTPIMLQNLIELKDKASADRVLGVLADALGISAQSFKASELKWDKDSSKEMNGFYRYAGDRRFTQANELYNRSVNRWFEKARNSENFKRLSDEEKLKIMRAAKREIKNQVFEHYGYK